MRRVRARLVARTLPLHAAGFGMVEVLDACVVIPSTNSLWNIAIIITITITITILL